MINLTIWTHWQGRTWTGKAPISRFQPVEDKLNEIWRFFNRVDEGDHERMAACGYELESLSTGDKVLLEGDWYEVNIIGFKPGTPPPAA